MNKLKTITSKYAYLIIFALMCLLFTILTDKFFTVANFINILKQSAVLIIAACGGALLIMTGGIDLSIGSIMSLSGMVCAYVLVNLQAPPLLCILCGILTGTACGLINGASCIFFNLTPFVVSLGTQTIFLGISYIICNGFPIYGFPDGFAFWGQGYVGSIPIPVITAIIVVIITAVFVHKSYFGRYIFAVGGNQEAARLAGINVKKMRFIIFGLSGLLAGVAGTVLCSRVNSGVPTTGSTYHSDVITSALLGGVTLNGGEGTIFGVMVGALTLGVLSNGMVLLNLGEYYQYLIKGLVLLAAVMYDVVQRRAKVRKSMAKKAG